MARKIIQYFSQCLNILKDQPKLTMLQNGNLKGLVDEIIKLPDISLTPTPWYDDNRMYLTFNGDCLKQDKFYYTSCSIINIYIVCDLTIRINSFCRDYNMTTKQTKQIN